MLSDTPNITIVCALKPGGGFDRKYVYNLYSMVKDNLSCPFSFICINGDVNIEKPKNDIGNFQHQWLFYKYECEWLNNWWCKIETFKVKGPVIYFDLDTAIFGSIDKLAQEVISDVGCFYMLKPFRKTERWASGIMAWNGDFSDLFFKFDPRRGKDLEYEWDQRYISAKLEEKEVKIKAIQSVLDGVYSYKHHCRQSLPDNARIVCFHGRPRPHEVGGIYFNGS